MEKNNKKNKAIFFLVFLVLLLFVAVGYAAWTRVYNGEKENSIDTATLILTLDETESNEISLINTVPVSDTKGVTFRPYTFKLKNSGTITANYRLKVIDYEKAYNDDMCSKLDWSNIRYSLKKDNEVATIGNLGEINGVLNIGEIDVKGTGYNNTGKVTCTNVNISDARNIAKLGVINNEAMLFKQNGTWNYFGDSIDVAFLSYGLKLGIKKDKFKIISSIPYESENKYSAVFFKENGKTYCTVKGSIEVISNFCTTTNGKRINRKKLVSENENLATQGYRVICVASGEVKEKDNYTVEDIKKLDFKGLCAFIDPIRKDVKQSLVKAKKAGIKVVMITGDHPLTAFSIAKKLDLVNSIDDIVTGSELDDYIEKGEKEFDSFIKDIKVFSRVTPLQKLYIVDSFKRQGEFVAVTGDGVNDAPALKSSNIGVAMGSGTDVAMDSSNMIIADDNFKSIVKGVEEGRTAYSNIRKVSYMLLSCGISEVLFFLLSIIFNLPAPLLAIQLLWLNVVTDGLQDFALSFEKTEDGTMFEKPRSTKESLFNRRLIEEVLVSGISIGLVVFIVWVILIKNNVDIVVSRTCIMTLMVFIQNIHVLNCRSEKKSIFEIPFNNPFIIIVIIFSILLQILIINVPLLGKFLKLTTIPFGHVVALLAISIIILIIVEIYKLLKNKS